MFMNAARALRVHCVEGITANVDILRHYVDYSIGTVTALNPVIGYDKATALAAEAMKTGRGILELLREKKILTEEQIAKVLDPAAMTGPGTTVVTGGEWAAACLSLALAGSPPAGAGPGAAGPGVAAPSREPVGIGPTRDGRGRRRGSRGHRRGVGGGRPHGGEGLSRGFRGQAIGFDDGQGRSMGRCGLDRRERRPAPQPAEGRVAGDGEAVVGTITGGTGATRASRASTRSPGSTSSPARTASASFRAGPWTSGSGSPGGRLAVSPRRPIARTRIARVSILRPRPRPLVLSRTRGPGARGLALFALFVAAIVSVVIGAFPS